ncbi:MAG: hypothetical protein JNJ73_05955 [Hyphomonadaceae bacterium]|nr:hypothetical protein [Hyphomonadaceae bacterium]
MLDKMVLGSRLLLGAIYLLSGLTYFFGFMPMLPHVGMPADLHIKHAVVVEMIKTGWMFQSAKIIEILFGLSMLSNRAVPLMLAAALPVTFITFMLDALILDDIWRWLHGAATTQQLFAAIEDMVVGGLCGLMPHLWLMWCFSAYYRPALVWKATPGTALSAANTGSLVPQSGWLRGVFFAWGWAAIALQVMNFYLFTGLIRFG